MTRRHAFAVLAAIALIGLLLQNSRGWRLEAQGMPVITGIIDANAERVVIDVRKAGAVGLQLVGTFVGTIEFEGSINGGTFVALNLVPSNSATAATSATAVGAWSGNIGGYSVVRARSSAWTSGSATFTGGSAASGGK